MSPDITWCWFCGRQLVRAKGGGRVRAVYTDPLGYKHAVHRACLRMDEHRAQQEALKRWESPPAEDDDPWEEVYQ